MRALRWHGALDLRVDTVDTPVAGAGQALVEVERVGLCGSDLQEYLHGPVDISSGESAGGGPPAPVTLGHEVTGTVVECPGNPRWIGRRVIPDVVEGCRTCWWCARHEEGLCPDLVVLGQHAPGGLADFMVCRADTLVAVPPHLELDLATFAEPASVAVRAVAKAGDLRGATTVVVGAGVVGNLVVQVARAAGAEVLVVDPSPTRGKLGLDAGASAHTTDAAQAEGAVHAATDGRMADVVFECSGRSAAFQPAVALARRGGVVVLVGLDSSTPPLPWRDVVLGEKRLIGTAAHMWDVDTVTAVRLLADGTVDPAPLISKVVSLAEVSGALDRLAEPNELAKVLVDPTRQDAS